MFSIYVSDNKGGQLQFITAQAQNMTESIFASFSIDASKQNFAFSLKHVSWKKEHSIVSNYIERQCNPRKWGKCQGIVASEKSPVAG
jgi:hypothetical protein